MIKRFGSLVLLVVFIVISCGFMNGDKSKSYSTDKIIETIKLLTSKDFNGRMAGTPDGIKTEEYIEARFKEMGLKPGGTSDTYFQEFEGLSGNAGPHTLEVLDNEKVVKTYRYGIDYKRCNSNSHIGELTSTGVEITESPEKIKKADGDIAILRNGDNVTVGKVCYVGYKGLIIESKNGLSRIKGQSGMEDKTIMNNVARVYVTTNTFNELLGYCHMGYKIHLKSSYYVNKFTARNVIGILKSKKPSDKCLIVSAHMDHLGPDPDGTYFPGALDNASGTASMLEIVRTLTTQRIKPDINVVFIAFSGEEEGDVGSSYYVQHPVYSLNNTRVINLDMVGAKSTMPLTIVKNGSGHRGSYETDIVDEFENKAKSTGIQYDIESGGNSDHDPFAKMGVPAVTLIDYEKTVYHVPEDTLDNIGIDNLRRDIDLAMSVIGDEIYTKGGSKQYIWAYLSGTFLIITAVSVFIYKKKSKTV